MKIYNYHPETFEYLGEGYADPDPLEPGNWLIPASSATFPPPEPIEGKNRHFENGTWVYKDPPPEPEKYEQKLTYVDKRSFAYPPIGEYLDAIVKGDNEQLQKYINDCLAVKQQIPKE
jgi:hypothetical protein